MTATQAPTPGPLSAQQEEAIAFNLCSLHGFDPAFVATQRDFAFAVIKEYERARLSLAPTAPVEASGSEELWSVGSWLSAALDDPKVCDAMKSDIRDWFDNGGHLRPQPSGFLATLTDEQRGEALAYTGDDTHPQMSGETQEEIEAVLDRLNNENVRYMARVGGLSPWIETFKSDLRTLLSDRPLALGGQQGEACRGCGHVGPVPKDRIACCPDGKRYDTTPVRAEAPSDDLRTACQAVLDDYQTSDAHHPDHVLIRRTDFERIKALVEAPVIARAEAQDEGAAGEPVAWRIRRNKGDAGFGRPQVFTTDEATDGDLWQWRRNGYDVQPLYAHPSPTPAADDDRVREGFETAKDAFEAILNPGFTVEAIREIAATTLAALKSTAAKEGGE